MNPDTVFSGEAEGTPAGAAGVAAGAAAGARGVGPLREEHVQALEQARRRARGVRKAAGFAKLSGVSTLVFGLVAVPFSLGSGANLALAIALVAIGYNELSLRRSLVRMNATACRGLAFNQLFLAGVLIAYAAWKILTRPAGGMIQSALASDPMLAEQLASSGIAQTAANIEALAFYGVYAGLIAGTVVFQGGAAVYYALRGRSVRKYTADTPAWVVGLNERGLLA
jgi:hypothetical protein